MPDLLIELLSEEIPARLQPRAAEALQKRMTEGLVETGLTYEGAKSIVTPRRLALAVQGLSAESPSLREERKGPAATAPMPALQGFLRSFGISHPTPETLLESLTPGTSVELEGISFELREVKGKQLYFATRDVPGRRCDEIVAEVLEALLRNFPWPKSMRWGSGRLRWVRPLHSILCLLSDEAGARVVPFELDGIKAGDVTRGHSFMAPEAFSVTSFDDYAVKLMGANVRLDPEERAQHIWADASNQAFARGLEVVEDKGLLAEVAGLVEWPVVLMGKIDEAYLALPPEVLKTSMREHQKFFSVRDPGSGKIDHYITVANIETPDHGATILAGNGRVLSARLADAKFFWENDLREARAGMGAWLESLAKVTFHNKLGSVRAQLERTAHLARDLAPVFGVSPDLAVRAAQVSKADLASEMVYEFPELQGVMGRYYSEIAGLGAEIAAVCEDHYAPLGPADDVPAAPLSMTVGLASKIDMLSGFWAIDEKPTGSKDPFALRRAALGVIRVILENDVSLGLKPVIAAQMWRHCCALEGLDDPTQGGENEGQGGSLSALALEAAPAHLREQVSVRTADLLAFIHERLKHYLRDRGLRHDIIDACLGMEGNDDLAKLLRRAQALADGLQSDEGDNLLQAFKRSSNILAQAEAKDAVSYELEPDRKFAETSAETALFDALDEAEPAISAAIEAEDFAAAIAAMARLREPIDAFFGAVQVNSENAIIRRNRLCLLHKIRHIGALIADLNRIEG